MEAPEAKRRKLLDLVEVLNQMHDVKAKQLKDNAASILAAAVRNDRPVPLGYKPCYICTNSVDGRGRCQRAMRVPDLTGQEKVNFRPWHITWIAANGHAPLHLQYSHRCNQENCAEESHGLWETDVANKARWSCRICSHLILPDGRIIRICPHEPCCLVPLQLDTWDDPRFVRPPVQ